MEYQIKITGTAAEMAKVFALLAQGNVEAVSAFEAQPGTKPAMDVGRGPGGRKGVPQRAEYRGEPPSPLRRRPRHKWPRWTCRRANSNSRRRRASLPHRAGGDCGRPAGGRPQAGSGRQGRRGTAGAGPVRCQADQPASRQTSEPRPWRPCRRRCERWRSLRNWDMSDTEKLIFLSEELLPAMIWQKAESKDPATAGVIAAAIAAAVTRKHPAGRF